MNTAMFLAQDTLLGVLRRVEDHAILTITTENGEAREHEIVLAGGTLILEHGDIECDLIVAELAYAHTANGVVTLRTVLPHSPEDHDTGQPVAEMRGWTVDDEGHHQLDADDLIEAFTHCAHCDEEHELEPGVVFIGADHDAEVDEFTSEIPTTIPPPSDDDSRPQRRTHPACDDDTNDPNFYGYDGNRQAVIDETARLRHIIDDHLQYMDPINPADTADSIYTQWCDTVDGIIRQALAPGGVRARLVITARRDQSSTHFIGYNTAGDGGFMAGETDLVHAELLHCIIRGGAAMLVTEPADQQAETRGWWFDTDYHFPMTVEQLTNDFGPAPDGGIYVGPAELYN